MTDTVKHTPGPWEKAVFDNPEGKFAIRGGKNVHGRPFVIAWVNKPGQARAGEPRANRNLIVASPDLLKALKDLLDAYSKPDDRFCCDGRDCGCMGSTVHQMAEHYARAAIAKAEGRS